MNHENPKQVHLLDVVEQTEDAPTWNQGKKTVAKDERSGLWTYWTTKDDKKDVSASHLEDSSWGRFSFGATVECMADDAGTITISDTCALEDMRTLRLSSELRKAVRMRDGYTCELQMSDSSNKVAESIEIMRGLHLDDMEKAFRLQLMARELQTKVHKKNHFILNLRRHYKIRNVKKFVVGTARWKNG
nr:hypothetical protein [Tanacetum cinerariifolium]